jgi:Subtilase family/Fibronectin type-III domain/PA domain/Peptidase inhibitor I9
MKSKRTLRPAALAAMILFSGMATAASAQEVRRSYIVQLVGAPAASYGGEVSGLPATKPAQGRRLDISAAHVQAYLSYLDSKQSSVLSNINPAHVTARYDVVLNGFAANLTDAEVRALKKNSAVLSIEADAVHTLHTSYTPKFIGLDAPGGLWAQLGGIGAAGENMIIGMLDSGVWPEDLSFADKVDATGAPTHDPSGTLVYGPPPAKWKGVGCEIKPGILAANCNNKLIGIRAYARVATANALEFTSGRDGTQEAGGGHGSHTASTAAGNAGVAAVVNGIPMGQMSGVAPRARIAAYKVCWAIAPGSSSCPTSNSVSAVNQAIKDGVDVINYSIGPTNGGGTFGDASTVAFLNASNAGVFVAASAGNSGPTDAPASNLGPWNVTVAASTHDRTIGAEAKTGAGGSYVGASVNQTQVNSSPLITATDAAKAGANLSLANLCYGAADGTVTLDPAKVTGKIVVCTRGTSPRVNKSLAVAQAGGIGMIMADNGIGLVAESHSVPTVHINQADGEAVKAYASGNETATASIGIAQTRFGDVLAPQIAGFSSRGPNVADNSILKPDLAAPGVDILAAYGASMTAQEVNTLKAGGTTTKTGVSMISGTSMASPHIAGLGLLLKQLRPTWSPAMIKSALMTTAVDTYDDGVNAPLAWSATANANGRLPWAQGAGQIVPTAAFNPGLVYDAGVLDYARFSCGLNLGLYSAATCALTGSIAPQNLNLPSLTAANVLGVQTLTRTVTNVGPTASTYSAAATMNGFDVEVTPSTLTLAPGASASFTVKLTRTTAPLDTWAYGSLVWSDGTHNVRSPLTARGSALVVPASLTSEAAAASKIFTIGTGFSGPMALDKGGLKAATRTAETLTGVNTGTSATICAANNSPAVNVRSVSIPADTLVARFQLFDAETTGGLLPGGEDDLDLLVLDPTGAAVAGSLNAGSNEVVTMIRPAAGNYRVCTIAYDTQGRSSTTYTMSSWVVTKTDTGGNFKALAPGMAYTGGTASAGMSWSGLAAGARYLGAVSFKVNGVPQGFTLLEVKTNDPVPVAVNSKPVKSAVD